MAQSYDLNDIFSELLAGAQAVADEQGKLAKDAPGLDGDHLFHRGAQVGALLVISKIEEAKMKYLEG